MGSTHLPHSRRPVDYYVLLGVPADATFRDIEQGYWQAAKTNRDQLPKLNEAYEVLGDPNRRAEYDKRRVVSNDENPKPTGPERLRPNPDRNKLRWYLQ